MTEEIKKARGGAREGAGRKKNEGKDVTKQVQFRLTEEQAVIVKKFVNLLKKQDISISSIDNINIELRKFYIEHYEEIFKKCIDEFE